jgi:hypothetical membrane protein
LFARENSDTLVFFLLLGCRMGRLAGALGVLGVILALAFPVYFGSLDPSYDPVRDFISELGDATAPDAWLVNWLGFLPTGLIQTGFALLAWRAMPRSWTFSLAMFGVVLFAAGYVGSAFFPCDTGCTGSPSSFSQQMHFAVGLPGYFLAPLTMLLLGLSVRKWPGGEWISSIAFFGAIGAFAGLSAVVDAFESDTPGLWQRVLEGSVLVPILAVSCHLLLRPKQV